MRKLEDMSNELLLCIWDQLSFADVIYSFSHLNSRIHQLLLEFYKLYKKMDLRYCSLTAFRYFCHQVPTMKEWRLNLTVLKLGNRYRCSQINSFVNEVIKLFMARYFTNEDKQFVNPSKDLFRTIMLSNKRLEPFFPQLTSLFIFQSTSIDEDCLNIFLYIVADGSPIHTLTWKACSYQTHHSKVFFNWLFQFSNNIKSVRLQSPVGENGFELTYDHTLMNSYLPHQSLTYLTISVLNLATLETLFHYLPNLQYLGKNQKIYIIAEKLE
jgi:hypothetical protein